MADEREEFSIRQFRPLVLAATDALGGEAHRRRVVERALDLGGFTADEFALPHTYKSSGYEGHLATLADYAVWHASQDGELEHGRERGYWRLTEGGRVALAAASRDLQGA